MCDTVLISRAFDFNPPSDAAWVKMEKCKTHPIVCCVSNEKRNAAVKVVTSVTQGFQVSFFALVSSKSPWANMMSHQTTAKMSHETMKPMANTRRFHRH